MPHPEKGSFSRTKREIWSIPSGERGLFPNETGDFDLSHPLKGAFSRKIRVVCRLDRHDLEP